MSNLAPTSVYLLLDRDENLLYVGISKAWSRRASQHAEDKAWWPEVYYARFEHFDSRREAADREAYLIFTLKPKYNVAMQGHGGVDCAVCHARPREHERRLCAGCRKTNQRHAKWSADYRKRKAAAL